MALPARLATSIRSLPRPFSFLYAAALGSVVTGCLPLTREEAAEAVEEAKLYSQAATLIGNSVELSSNFTIGGAVEDAIANLQDFYAAQLPCAEVSVDSPTLTIEFGAKPGNCTYRGMTFKGTHEVTLSKVTTDAIVVEHVWTDLRNAEMNVSGTAKVTWTSGDDPSRRVEHDLVWTRISDGREATGTGDRTQRALDGDLSLGVTVTGDASWEGESGLWSLSSDEVAMRWIDPIPEAGSYVLETPFNKTLTLEFERTAATTIHLTASSGGREYESDVTTAP